MRCWLARQKVFPDETHGSARSTNLLMEVSKNETGSPGAGYAGLELKGVRFLNVAVNASPKIERMGQELVCGLHGGLSHGIRLCQESRPCHRRVRQEAGRTRDPHWGKHEVPDQYVDLGRHDLYELDLRQWAPPGWDGQVWFTLVLQQAGLGTSLTAQLMPLAKAA